MPRDRKWDPNDVADFARLSGMEAKAYAGLRRDFAKTITPSEIQRYKKIFARTTEAKIRRKYVNKVFLTNDTDDNLRSKIAREISKQLAKLYTWMWAATQSKVKNIAMTVIGAGLIIGVALLTGLVDVSGVVALAKTHFGLPQIVGDVIKTAALFGCLKMGELALKALTAPIRRFNDAVVDNRRREEIRKERKDKGLDGEAARIMDQYLNDPPPRRTYGAGAAYNSAL